MSDKPEQLLEHERQRADAETEYQRKLVDIQRAYLRSYPDPFIRRKRSYTIGSGAIMTGSLEQLPFLFDGELVTPPTKPNTLEWYLMGFVS